MAVAVIKLRQEVEVRSALERGDAERDITRAGLKSEHVAVRVAFDDAARANG